MPSYAMIKHYRGPKTRDDDPSPADWGEGEWAAHLAYMDSFADRLRASGEFVSSNALAPEGQWIRSGGEGRAPESDRTSDPSKDLVAGWMIVEVASHDRAVELAAELSAAPGPGGVPLREWLELRPVLHG